MVARVGFSSVEVAMLTLKLERYLLEAEAVGIAAMKALSCFLIDFRKRDMLRRGNL